MLDPATIPAPICDPLLTDFKNPQQFVAAPVRKSYTEEKPDPQTVAWRHRYVEDLFKLLEKNNLDPLRYTDNESALKIVEGAMWQLRFILFQTDFDTPFRFSPDPLPKEDDTPCERR